MVDSTEVSATSGPFPAPAGAVLLQRSELELVALLKETVFGRIFSHGEIEILAGRMRAYELDAGRPLFRQGDREVFACLIVSGEVEVAGSKDPVSEQVIAVLGPGETCGEMSLIDGGPRSASVYTTARTRVLVLDQAGFEYLTQEEPYIAYRLVARIAKSVCRRLRRTNQSLVTVLEAHGGVEVD